MIGPFASAIAGPVATAITSPGVGGGGVSYAPIVILVGQSLNASRGTKELTSAPSGSPKMPTDGVSVVDFAFYGSNQNNCGNWDSFATFDALAEGTGQSPCVGIATTLAATYAQSYIVSVAVGARKLSSIRSQGQRANVYASLQRMIAQARADGYEPLPMFYSAHGEADAVAGTSEATYYADGMDYYKMLQLAAAQALGDPSYVAPIYLTYPAQTNGGGTNGANDVAIKNAIRRIGKDLTGAIDAGPVYHWPCNSDRVHPTPASYILRGEHIGRKIAQADTTDALYITGVTLSGTTFVATFSKSIVRDNTLGNGNSLNASYALDGFEWMDNGSYIKINSINYSGNTATGTLNATPSGSLAQQRLRIASHATTITLTSGADYLAGSLVRAAGAGWASTYNPAYTNYDWAIPQECEVTA